MDAETRMKDCRTRSKTKRANLYVDWVRQEILLLNVCDTCKTYFHFCHSFSDVLPLSTFGYKALNNLKLGLSRFCGSILVTQLHRLKNHYYIIWKSLLHNFKNHYCMILKIMKNVSWNLTCEVAVRWDIY